MKKKIVIDGAFAPLGRLASFAAKQALLGSEIIIVNCDSVLVSGKKEMILREYKTARARGGASLKGPHFPKSPERIVKRTIRGMLSYKDGRGRATFEKIRCYNKIPPEYERSEKITLMKDFKIKTISLKELSEIL